MCRGRSFIDWFRSFHLRLSIPASMGLCASSNLTPAERAKLEEEARQSRLLEKQITRDQSLENQIHKLLLLGAGESGKSTLFKQALALYAKGFEKKDERMSYKPVICNNILSSIKTLCEQSELQANRGEATQVHPDLESSKRYILDMKMSDTIDPNLGAHVKALWHDPGIQRTYEVRARYQLTDSAAYFFNEIDQVVKDDFCPSLQDVLRSRVRTTGIVEHEFQIDGNRFKMFDVGGQRNERKKWIHCFSEVTALIFVAALSEYDMLLFEDDTTNRMHEALELFKEIVNLGWFKKTAVILFLNKSDLFVEKIKEVPLTVCFPDYTGPQEYQACLEYIREHFEVLKKDRNSQVYTHITCATDTGNMSHVFRAVTDIVIRRSLQEGGLLA